LELAGIRRRREGPTGAGRERGGKGARRQRPPIALRPPVEALDEVVVHSDRWHDALEPISRSVSASRAARFHLAGHASQFRAEPETWAVASAADGADERARLVERQRRDVRAEIAPQALLVQILLDVGEIERRDGGAFVFQVLPHRADRFRAREIADDGHEEILRLEIL